MIRILSPNDYRVMPWKNGGGTTTEILIHPEGAGWEDFEWRVGIAEVRQSGPFSSCPGSDRSILLLECPKGSVMRLSVDGSEVELPPRRFVDFKGESATSAMLLGAPVRDFNVMSRRASVRHERGFEKLGARESWPVEGDGAHFIHLVDGAATSICGNEIHSITAGTSLLLTEGDAGTLRADSGPINFVWARFVSV